MAPRVRLLWREHRHDAGDPHLSQTLHPVKILAQTERGDLDRSRIAAGFSCDLAEFRQDLGNIAAGRGMSAGTAFPRKVAKSEHVRNLK
jgi:hypothetical protein